MLGAQVQSLAGESGFCMLRDTAKNKKEEEALKDWVWKIENAK